MKPEKLEVTLQDNVFVSHKDDHSFQLKSFDFDSKMDDLTDNENIVVVRRGPINPLKTLRTLHKKNKAKVEPSKVKNDPGLKNNPLRGRLIVLISSSTAILFVFLAQMVFNKATFGGRCLTKVMYKDEMDQKPIFVPIGHGACEYNLKTESAKRMFLGPSEADKGWPIQTVTDKGTQAEWNFASETDKDAIQINSLHSFGGLDTNMIRNYGENFRLLWSTFMHKGIWHIGFNLLSQIQMLWIIEPDWGFKRTFILYFISALGSSVTSAALDPCNLSVGSSGVLYGLYGGLLPYIIEYWTTLPYPLFLIIFTLVSLLIGIVMGLTDNIDNYAHLGGCMFGMLWGFTSIKSVSIFDKCTFYESIMLTRPMAWLLTKKYKEKLKKSKHNKKNLNFKEIRREHEENFVKKSCLNKRLNRLSQKLSNNTWPPFRNRMREWVVRICASVLLVSFGILLSLLVFEPNLYTKFKPWGQLKFSGFSKCRCCFIRNMKNLFPKEELKYLYKENQLYWCFDQESTADLLCGSALGSNQTDDFLTTSSNAAQHVIDSIF